MRLKLFGYGHRWPPTAYGHQLNLHTELKTAVEKWMTKKKPTKKGELDRAETSELDKHTFISRMA